MLTGRLPCEFDELSYNVLHNRILKATMRRLIRTQGLAVECSEGLAQLCRLLSDIQDIELTNRVFGQVQLYRNNQFYDFLLKVCELIHRNLLISEKSGQQVHGFRPGQAADGNPVREFRSRVLSGPHGLSHVIPIVPAPHAYFAPCNNSQRRWGKRADPAFA